MTMAKPITLDNIEGWLKDMGYKVKRAPPAPEYNWNLEVESSNPATPYRITVFNPKAAPRMVAVVGGVMLSNEHRVAHGDLDDDEKGDFSRELTRALDRDFTEYGLVGATNELECPAGFQVTAARFDDGLHLDSLWQTVQSVFKTMIAGIACVNRHLNPRGAGGAGHFEFKRMGSIQ
jgi:hypothetical protein